jgi:hypothetical protein
VGLVSLVCCLFARFCGFIRARVPIQEGRKEQPGFDFQRRSVSPVGRSEKIVQPDRLPSSTYRTWIVCFYEGSLVSSCVHCVEEER